MLSGDIKVNPGPKTNTNRRTAKSRFLFDLNTDASLAHSDPKELATKYHVSVRTVRRWLSDCLPLRFTSHNPFLTILNCYLSVTSRYVKNIMYTLDLLRDGSKTTNIPGLHVVLMWIILIIKSWQKSMVFEQQQSTYGKRKRTHNGQFGMNIVNKLLIVVMGLRVCASRFVFVVSVG